MRNDSLLQIENASLKVLRVWSGLGRVVSHIPKFEDASKFLAEDAHPPHSRYVTLLFESGNFVSQELYA